MGGQFHGSGIVGYRPVFCLFPDPCFGASAPAPKLVQLQPLVAPQVLHFMQVPLRTSV